MGNHIEDYYDTAIYTLTWDDGYCFNRSRTVEVDLVLAQEKLGKDLKFDLKLCEECGELYLSPFYFHYEDKKEAAIDTPLGLINVAVGVCDRCYHDE